VEVSNLRNVSHISAGAFHTCAILDSGTAHCWGYNEYGQLGDGTYTSSYSPLQVQGLFDLSSISGANYHTCAVLKDGTARCWGANYIGQLGDGTNVDSIAPISVLCGEWCLTF
jgi:alpha-tubulin suppressor-like RCC1 family protein